MKKLISLMLIFVMITSFMTIAVQADNNDGILDSVNDVETIFVTDTARFTSVNCTKRTNTGVEGATVYDFYTANQSNPTMTFTVASAYECFVKLEVTGARRYSNSRGVCAIVNGDESSKTDTKHFPTDYGKNTNTNSDIKAFDTMELGTVKLDAKNDNTIALTTGNGAVATQIVVESITLTVVDVAPVISETATLSDTKPCINEAFDFYVDVTDENLEAVVCSLNDGADEEMEFDDESGMYKIAVTCTNAGENKITVTATDESGFVTTKNFTVNCVEYKVKSDFGITAENAEGDKIKLTGTVGFNNSSDASIDACLVIMLYNSDNMMVGFNFSEMPVAANTPDGELEVELTVDDVEDCTVELAVWDSILGMNYLTDSVYSDAAPTAE